MFRKFALIWNEVRINRIVKLLQKSHNYDISGDEKAIEKVQDFINVSVLSDKQIAQEMNEIHNTVEEETLL